MIKISSIKRKKYKKNYLKKINKKLQSYHRYNTVKIRKIKENLNCVICAVKDDLLLVYV